MMWLTTMNPETRRLIKVMPEDAEKTAFYFDLLLGGTISPEERNISPKTAVSIWKWRIFRSENYAKPPVGRGGGRRPRRPVAALAIRTGYR